MRPLYETDTDRQNERETIKILADAWGVNFVKLKMSCVIDYALLDGKTVVAVVEVKNRNYTRADIDRFGGLMISTNKFFAAKNWTDVLGVPFVLLAQLKDGLFYWVIEADWPIIPIEMAGRTDRGDWQDVEPCCMIPMSWFKEWGK